MKSVLKEKSEIISISLPAKLKKDLFKYAKREDIGVSQLAKEAFRAYLVTEQLERINKGFRKAALKLGIESDEDVERLFK